MMYVQLAAHDVKTKTKVAIFYLAMTHSFLSAYLHQMILFAFDSSCVMLHYCFLHLLVEHCMYVAGFGWAATQLYHVWVHDAWNVQFSPKLLFVLSARELLSKPELHNILYEPLGLGSYSMGLGLYCPRYHVSMQCRDIRLSRLGDSV